MNNKIKIRLYRSTRNATPACLSTSSNATNPNYKYANTFVFLQIL